MRSVRASRVSRGLLALFVCLMMVSPLVVAQDQLEYYVEPDASRAETIQDLFNGVMLVALFVFVFVELLILYIIWRFRNNKTTPKDEHHRGHTKAEIAWTIIPALILIIIGIASVGALQEIDVVPEDPDFYVDMTAGQFFFNFEYPDGSSSQHLAIREGSRVALNITSGDVIHALWIPEFALKIDAVPGRVNQVWFEAPTLPEGVEQREYWIQCAEYCGSGHHTMGWASKVIVFKGNRDFGVDTGPVNTTHVEALVGNVFEPVEIRVEPGETVTWYNNDSSATRHTVTPNDKAQWGTEGSGDAPAQWMAQGDTYQFAFSTPGVYTYRCIPHSFQNDQGQWQGMVGTVYVGNVTADGSQTAG